MVIAEGCASGGINNDVGRKVDREEDDYISALS
ncbi:hypothetical protein MMC2321_04889 [Chitinophaga sp. MM2321]